MQDNTGKGTVTGSEDPSNLSPSLNTILFGPPGTGKTYSTIDKVVAILNPDLYQADNHKANKVEYEKLLKEGRVVFTTFHQSMTYEDFVEGIKPVMEESDENGDVNYKIEDGIFKQMCIKASYEFIKLQEENQPSRKTLTFGQLYDIRINEFQERLDKGEEILIPLKGGGEIEVKEISRQGNFILQHQNGQRSYTVSKNRLEKLYNEIEDLNNISNIYSYFRSIIGGSNASAYWAILNQLDLQTVEVISAPEASINYEDKRNAFSRINWNEVNTKLDLPKYVIVIDEINRGNIASILGELITLLEEDKRGGAKESLVVTLPYSKTSFSVPPNLYIIGTMNTADRSVEALDTALRRRFSFKEIQPDPDLLEDIKFGGIDFPRLLTTINQRIEKLLNKDYMIGHAYFMGLSNTDHKEAQLKSIFTDKVLPLLQEYFYGSFGKIQLVLGRKFVEIQSDENVQFAPNDFNGSDYEEKIIYKIKNVADVKFDIVEAVKSIYLPDEKE